MASAGGHNRVHRIASAMTSNHSPTQPAFSTLHDALDHWAIRQPDRLFAIEPGRQLTYAEAREATLRLASAFRAANLRRGDRIAVLSTNRVEVVLLYYAASAAGITVVPLNTRLAGDEWAFILSDARPRALFVENPFLAGIDALRATPLATVERYVALDTSNARRPGWEPFERWQAHATDPDAVTAEVDRDVLQLYTSATTGKPKGAVLTERAVCANIAQIAKAVGITPGERSLVVAPLFHAAVVPSTLTPLAGGGTIYLQREFRPTEVVRILDQEHIGFAVLVPAMLHACLSRVPDLMMRRFAALRLVYYGSSAIAGPTLRASIEAFRCGFMQSYGMTEATQAVTFLSPEDHLRGLAEYPNLLLSAGTAAADTEIAIVDSLDRRLGPGEPGEVVVRGPQLMRGYWNQSNATATALRNGWLYTGDVGTLDENGYLYIRDRLKDMIVSGGENVYPRAVEDVLARHPAVAEAAVIGVPDERWGETVKAVVVPRSGALTSSDEVIAFCRQHLGGFEVPRSVDFVEALPRNASGKVLKRVLREAYWVGEQRRVAGA
jgi:acyl-CoA synthetase (AMP-forming)/AMP-acid ligase II